MQHGVQRRIKIEKQIELAWFSRVASEREVPLKSQMYKPG